LDISLVYDSAKETLAPQRMAINPLVLAV